MARGLTWRLQLSIGEQDSSPIEVTRFPWRISDTWRLAFRQRIISDPDRILQSHDFARLVLDAVRTLNEQERAPQWRRNRDEAADAFALSAAFARRDNKLLDACCRFYRR